MPRAAVIGASGFIGRNLCRELITAGWQVTGYGKSTSDETAACGLRREVDYRRLDITADAIEYPPQTDVVYYLAQSPAYRDSPRRAEALAEVNTHGPIRAAAAAAEAGVRFFCHASTGNVYQPSFSPLAETHPLRRDYDPYAISKVAAEEALLRFHDRLPATSARIFGAFGPGQTGMLVQRIVEQVAAGRPVVLQPSPLDLSDDGGLRVSFCYIDDLCRLLQTHAERALSGVEVPPAINLAGPNAVSMRQLADEIGRAIGRTPQFETPNVPREFDLVADTTLQDRLLNPRFTPFAAAVARTVVPH